jgi:ATPase family associated with various cellular activities (AAA)
MTANDRAAWTAANQQYLMARLAAVRECVARQLDDADAGAAAPRIREAQDAARDAQRAMPSPSALDAVCELFSLSDFERDLLLLCAGVELDGVFASLCGRERGRAAPTFGLALAALPESHWSAITPAGPLRHWRLIDVGAGDVLTTSPLRIDERILHYLAGISCIDERLRGLLTYHPKADLPASQQPLAAQIAALWSVDTPDAPPVVHLGGDDGEGAVDVAAAACGALGLELHGMTAASVPADATERDLLTRLWEREAMLTRSALVLEGDDGELPAPAAAFVDHVRSYLLLDRCRPPARASRRIVRFAVGKPTAGEQARLWEASLDTASFNGHVETLVSQFDLPAAAIEAAAAQAHAHPEADAAVTFERLWEACRVATRGRLDDLAQRIDPSATWDDLVLPTAQLHVLRDMAAQVRQRHRVYQTWGFAEKGSRGLGISALFAGPSGTGKTMAAEVLARDLRLDLYRLDLSQVVNKYIGETEKNLRRVFDAADAGGAVLLFDEADALFGKRSEVKDSHDRYANIEVSYLLQRMEAYRGLAILTTNMKTALDDAFLRRLRFIVQFPFPDAAHRAEIWRRVYPDRMPRGTLDYGRLARLNIPGGHIRNIALHAAFFAAAAEEPVGMPHLLRAARCEYAKLERPLTDAEVAGWV